MDKPTKKMDYSGMTLNERMYVAGLLNEWDLAKSRSDRISMMRMLRHVDVDEQDANSTIRIILDRQARSHPDDFASK